MNTTFTDLELANKPDFVDCMKRVYAWYEGEIIDRPPVRFSAHNAQFETADTGQRWATLKDRWFDAEYQVEHFIASLSPTLLGETFPVFWPNLGPNVFAAILGGGELTFGEVTSWTHPVLDSADDASRIRWRDDSEYIRKLLELTDCALERCDHRFMVGYTDIHPSLDCLDALLGTEALCVDMYDDPDSVTALTERCFAPLEGAMRLFHDHLKAKKQLSVTWMNIPSYGTMHIPSCDLSTMLSREHFDQFALPYIRREAALFTHNIFHMDGKGVARHLDSLLQTEAIHGIQWVQGVGEDRPILQWIPLIQKIQGAGKGVVVDLHLCELEDFISLVSPKGIYLCIDETDPLIQQRVMDRLLRWK